MIVCWLPCSARRVAAISSCTAEVIVPRAATSADVSAMAPSSLFDGPLPPSLDELAPCSSASESFAVSWVSWPRSCRRSVQACRIELLMFCMWCFSRLST